MTPGEAYWVGRPAEETRNPVVVSHRPIVNSNLPVSYLCMDPTRAGGRGDTYLQGDGVFAAIA